MHENNSTITAQKKRQSRDLLWEKRNERDITTYHTHTYHRTPGHNVLWLGEWCWCHDIIMCYRSDWRNVCEILIKSEDDVKMSDHTANSKSGLHMSRFHWLTSSQKSSFLTDGIAAKTSHVDTCVWDAESVCLTQSCGPGAAVWRRTRWECRGRRGWEGGCPHSEDSAL